jgi:putative ABC transport system permease protein
VRTIGRPELLAPALRRIVQDIDPTLPVFRPQTLDEVVRGSISDRRLRLQIAAAFAALALGLAAVALWGAVAQNVLDRRHELAVRLALGSTSASAVGLLLRRGFVLTGIGVALGAAGGVVTARTLRHLLRGVGPFDPPSFIAGIVLAALVSIVACYLPARRAAAISPAQLLRQA